MINFREAKMASLLKRSNFSSLRAHHQVSISFQHMYIIILLYANSCLFNALVADWRVFPIEHLISIQAAEGLPLQSRRQIHVEPGAREKAVSVYLISIWF